MNYAAPVNRTIITNKTLNTVCRLDKNQRAIRDFCHTHTIAILEDKNGDPFAQFQEKTDERVAVHVQNISDTGIKYGRCPSCKEFLNEYYHPHYCGFCGQSIRWDE